LLDDYCTKLTPVSRHQTLSSNTFCIHNQIDVSAHTNYLIEFLKSEMPGTMPDKERKLYARMQHRQHQIHKKIQIVLAAPEYIYRNAVSGNWCTVIIAYSARFGTARVTQYTASATHGRALAG